MRAAAHPERRSRVRPGGGRPTQPSTRSPQRRVGVKPLVPVQPGARVALGIAFFVLFVAAWAAATLGGFVSKTFLADPLTMLAQGWTLFAEQASRRTSG